MNIEQLVKIWSESKYERLMIQFIDCVGHDKDIVKPTGIYKKGETILFGGKFTIEEHLINIYKDSIFFIEKEDSDTIYAYEIYRVKR